ncbi:MAG TPA: hypothetical protein IAB37_04825 [Candidatus Faecivivens stercoravium]|uniref:Uncharacterized protein n=1 Tax=Candidatus Faecivivens stercoravium TaxID=2840803 RepID=A0A9D1J4W7_9FIRM|nr:hypothetical protein [Candidatus Faecivivens stercoravium]
MERIRSLGRYQKGILILMAAMILLFTALYPIVLSREGFLYRDALLIPSEEGGNTVYAGKIEGQPASFTLYDDRSVQFRYGDSVYGPYTAKEAPDALQNLDLGDGAVGVELRCGEELVFRGGVLRQGDGLMLFAEDGSVYTDIGIMTSGGFIFNEEGEVIDPNEPSVSDILMVMAGPPLTHKGSWLGWVMGVIACILTAVDILFADELFRLHMAFHISRAEDAEPSDWEIAGRYIGWTVLPAIALVLFIIGLQ